MSLCGSECVAPCAIEAVADHRAARSSERHHGSAGPRVERTVASPHANVKPHVKASPQSW